MKGKKRYINLTEKERGWLESGYKTGKKNTFRIRCHYILLSDQGFSMKEICKIHSISQISLGKWFTRFEEQGISGLHTAKGQGRPEILRIDNDADSKLFEDWVEDNAQNLKPILAKIEIHFGKTISKRTLQRILKKTIIDGNDFDELPQENQTNLNTN